MAPRNAGPSAPSTSSSGKRRGRPRRWTDDQERYREHGKRRGARAARVQDLLDAVRNAYWEDRELQRTINDGDDLEVLTALTAYYRARHWQRVLEKREAEARREE